MQHSSPRNTLITIAGPTASGKTALAIALAKHFGTDIISADSRQFYREMNIGTAKPSVSELQEVTHHFIDSHSISQPINAGQYETGVISLLDDLFANKNPLIVAGGSGLYIRAVLHGFDLFPDIDPAIRSQLNESYRKKGISYLQERLGKVDPDYYRMVDKNNPQRLIRALEVYDTSGVPYSKFRQKKPPERTFRSIVIGLELPRDRLYNLINQRVENMMAAGLLDEVKSLLPYRNDQPLDSVGYKELFMFLDSTCSLEEAVDMIKKNTRHYAKRQMTWFKKEPGIRWFHPNAIGSIIDYIESEMAAG